MGSLKGATSWVSPPDKPKKLHFNLVKKEVDETPLDFKPLFRDNPKEWWTETTLPESGINSEPPGSPHKTHPKLADVVVSSYRTRRPSGCTGIPPAQLDSFEGLPPSKPCTSSVSVQSTHRHTHIHRHMHRYRHTHTWINIRIYIYIDYIDITTTWGITSTQPTGSSSLVRLWKLLLFGMTTFSLSTDVLIKDPVLQC